MISNQFERFIERVYAHDAKYRTENLLTVNEHLRRYAIEQRRAEEETLTRNFGVAPVDHNGCAFRDPDVDVGSNAVAMFSRHERTHLYARLFAATDA